MSKLVVNHHQYSAVAVEKRVRMCKMTHDLTRMRRHIGTILTKLEGIMDSTLCKSRMHKQVIAVTSYNGDLRCRNLTILTSPRVHVLKQYLVRVEDIPICDRLKAFQILDGACKIFEKDAVLKPLDLGCVLQSF